MDNTPRGDDPVAVVRAWVEAPFEQQGEFLTGPILEFQRLHDGVESTYTMTKASSTVRTLGLREQTDGYAVCDLDADYVYVVRSAAGENTYTRTVGGPVVLARTPDGWRIADYDAQGRRAVESIRLYDGARIELPGLTIAPLGLGLRATGTVVVLELTNGAADEIAVHSFALPRSASLMKEVPWAYVDGRTRLAPGGTVRVEPQSPLTLPLETDEITFSMFLRGPGRRMRLVKLTVPFAERSARPHATLKRLRGLKPRQAWLINAAVVVAIVALLGVPGWVPGFGDSPPDPNSSEGVVAAFVDAARDGDDAEVRQLAVAGNQAMLVEAAGEIRDAVALGFTETDQYEGDGEVTVSFQRPSGEADCWFAVAVGPTEVDGTWRLAYALADTEDMCIE